METRDEENEEEVFVMKEIADVVVSFPLSVSQTTQASKADQ